ncbi:hypothetical protein AXG93_154s2020 [Marchantia polymorpha subsp. ruderalis]|uniref:DUF7806 domain-containing protein n=1 Tax=Marchantia polymorpha subsp. ruderalis TaxID=1480154 RepID=A0A176VJI7_MARPO|nr:hypothetical protein AXG93_154s2020 [Marchantia polymorpha subsp. ruderalis]
MAKRKAETPLHILSPNDRGTRRSSRTTPSSRWCEGKENDVSRGSDISLKSPRMNSAILPGELSSCKQSRLGRNACPNSSAQTAPSRVANSLTDYDQPGRDISISGKNDHRAGRPRGSQLSKGVIEVDKTGGGTSSRDRHDVAGAACEHSGCPDDFDCSLSSWKRSRTTASQEASRCDPISGKKDRANENKNVVRSGVENVEIGHESIRKDSGTSDSKGQQRSKEDHFDNPSTGKETKDDVLPVKPMSDLEGQAGIDQRGKNHRCAEDGFLESAIAVHQSSIPEDSVETEGQTRTGSASGEQLRNHETPVESGKVDSEDTKHSREAAGRERIHGAPNGTLQGDKQGCPCSRGVGRPFVDAEAAAQVLEEAYNKLYKKYQRSKTRNLAEVEALYDEQTKRFAAFSTAADALVGKLREENRFLNLQLQETGLQKCINRSRLLEDQFIECKNDLVMERSKVLELERELREAQSCILELRTTIGSLLNSTSNVTTVLQPCEAPHTVKLGIEDIAEPGSRDMETLRSSETPPPFSVAKDEVTEKNVSAVDSGNAELEFPAEGALQISHRTEVEACARQANSGFSFKLEQNNLSKAVGGNDALLYRVMVPGTLIHLAPEWMKSEIVFDVIQAHVFFQRILTIAHGFHSN